MLQIFLSYVWSWTALYASERLICIFDLTWSWFYVSSSAGVPVAWVGSRWLVILIVTGKFYGTACPSCCPNSTFTVSEKRPSYTWAMRLAVVQTEDHPPSNMQVNRCYTIPVTHLKCYCHPGCDRLFRKAVVTQYLVIWDLTGTHGRWILQISSAQAFDFI